MLLLNPFDHGRLDFYAKFIEILVYYDLYTNIISKLVNVPEKKLCTMLSLFQIFHRHNCFIINFLFSEHTKVLRNTKEIMVQIRRQNSFKPRFRKG
jgi:hypothetical protein